MSVIRLNYNLESLDNQGYMVIELNDHYFCTVTSFRGLFINNLAEQWDFLSDKMYQMESIRIESLIERIETIIQETINTIKAFEILN